MSMTTTIPILEAVKLSRRHPDGRHWLLEDVSLEVHPGTAVAVTGPSGAGKTLLLRAMAMLDPIDLGEVRLFGHTHHHDAVPALRRQVIYLHQRPVLLGETVAQALAHPFSLVTHRRQRFQHDRVAAWLGQWGRDETFLDKRIADLSGGESQLVALARGLQLDPAVLLLDEPTSALDAVTAMAVESDLRRWLDDAPTDRAMVWVGHDATQMARVADRTWLIRAGRMMKEEEDFE